MRRSRTRISRIIGEIENNGVWLGHNDNISTALWVEAVQDSARNRVRRRNPLSFKLRTREITGDARKLHRRFTYDALALIQIDAVTRQRCTIQIKVAINQAEFSFAFVAEVANVILRRAILARVASFEGRLNQLVEIFFLIAMAGKISSRCF